MPYLARVCIVGTVVVLLSVVAGAQKKKTSFLPRSIYLPIEFVLCEHLHDAVLYRGKQALSALPGKRIFQFTYYPTLDRIEPQRTDVRVVGVKDDGASFVGKLAVTPWGVFTANQKVELNIDEQLAKMRYKIDVRYDALALTLRCEDDCEGGVVHSERSETDRDTVPETPSEKRSPSW